MDLYEKILGEYSSIGGGALLLTPILGEFFLDKHAIERIRLARSFDNIGTISLTTNALATNRFSDDDLATFFLGTNYLQISMGGVHEKQYSEMFGVDKFELAISNVERLVRIRDSVAPNYPIRIAFRVNVTEGELRSDPRFERFKSMNIETVIDSTFGNWGGSIGQSSLPEGSSYRPVLDVTKKRSPCFMFYLGLYVAANGIATACGCMDSELKLSVGDCKTDHLTDLWKGAVRSGYKHSFEQSNPPDICKKCNFYQDGEIFLQTPEVQAFEIGRFPFGY